MTKILVFRYTHDFPAGSEFSRAGGWGGYSTVPATSPFYSAFQEGWAVYSQTLGLELGLFDDPFDRFGHFFDVLGYAARLVVDTGINAKGWTEEKALQYLLEHDPSTEAGLAKEVARMATWPGQATAYRMGQRAVLAARRQRELELREMFDLREFHADFLSCRGPLDLVPTCLKRRLATRIVSDRRADEESK